MTGEDRMMVDTAADYRLFASQEARGESPLYERLALGVAGDGELLALLSGLPPGKRQPNLLFAAARHVGGRPAGFAQFRRCVLDNRDAVVATMLSHRTQTNEPARCLALYPLLAALPQPLALLEMGASAGLCLLPDRYGYDLGGRRAGALASTVQLRCRVEGPPPAVPPAVPTAAPDAVTVVWRAGIDLNPLDVTDPEDVRWLRTLVWPEQHDRLDRLDAAIALARADPPRLVRGDLNARLPEVAAQAPAGATLVVFHTAVLYYLSAADRSRFEVQVEGLGGHWVSQEIPGVLPSVDARLGETPPVGTRTYTVALDGHPVAFSAVHGGWLRWLG